MRIQRIALALVAAVCSRPGFAVEYACEVTRKFDREREYTAELDRLIAELKGS